MNRGFLPRGNVDTLSGQGRDRHLTVRCEERRRGRVPGKDRNRPLVDTGMDIFLSGLGGALLGSLIGFLGSWWIQGRALRHDEHGAARALFFEMVANAATLRRMNWDGSTGRRPERLARTTWEATQSRIGALLKPNEFLVVAQAYEDLPGWQTFIDDHAGVEVLSPREKDMLTEAADSIVEAAEILRDRAWSKRDLDNFPEFRGGAQVQTEEAAE